MNHMPPLPGRTARTGGRMSNAVQAGNLTRWVAITCLTAVVVMSVMATPLSGNAITLRMPSLARPCIRAEPPLGASKACRWSPFLLSLEDQKFAMQMALSGVPTMVSGIRMLLTAQLAVGALRNAVPGDFVETGTASGGASIVMMMVLNRFDPNITRKHWAADSFQGLPEPVEKDRNGTMYAGVAGQYAVSRQAFMNNTRNPKFGLAGSLELRLRVLPGWFNDTLPVAGIEQIAFLRIDGDMYVSTRDPLDALYDKVAPGGIIYIDDYGSFTGCKRAVDEFRNERNITAPLMFQALPEGELQAPSYRWEAAWFIKPPCASHGS